MSAKESNGKTFWNKCGSAWLNKAGTGYNLVLDMIPAPIDGAYRMNLFEPRENNNFNNNSNNNSGSSYNDSGSSGGFNRPGTNRGQQLVTSSDEIPF